MTCRFGDYVEGRAFYQQHAKIGQNVSMPRLLVWKIAALIAITLWLLVAFTADEPLQDWRKGELVIVLPPAEMEVEAAFEADLVALFAKQLLVKVRPLSLPADEILPALADHKAHFAAAGLRNDSNPELHFSATYQVISEQLICNGAMPNRLSDLAGLDISVAADSPQEIALRKLQPKIPGLHWESRRHQTTAALLHEVAEGQLECTVANEEQLILARNFYPDLGDGFDLGLPSRLAWAFPADADPELQQAADKFFQQISQEGTLRRLLDHHYGHNERLEPVDAVTFVTKVRTVLPHYRRWFEEAASLTGLDWQLLAALSYQESHWEPLATSFTNVRGMMMLTEDTADRMNVENRLDPHASILAGARYLQLLKEQLPLRINEDDRLWMALAAYNQGMGHLEDARILAKQSGLNPDAWADVKRVMPLLSRPAYYSKAKRGQARGGEAVILVETVRLYHDMLKRMAVQDLQLPAMPYYGLIGKRTQVSVPSAQ